MKHKHSRGPWHAHTDLAQPVITALGEPNEPQVAVVTEIEGESEYNAHLIAAAPEMLEALEALLKAIGSGVDADPKVWRKAHRLADAAITKAKGGSQ